MNIELSQELTPVAGAFILIWHRPAVLGAPSAAAMSLLLRPILAGVAMCVVPVVASCYAA
jgi:hypothetical protein